MNYHILIITILLCIIFFCNGREEVSDYIKSKIAYDNVTVNDLIITSTKHILQSNDSKVSYSIKSFMRNNAADIHRSSFRLLCATVVESSKIAFKHLLRMIFTIEGDCHWAIMVQHGDMQLAAYFNRTLHSLKLNRSRIVLYEYKTSRETVLAKYGLFNTSTLTRRLSIIRNTIANEPYNHLILPKSMILTALIPIVRKYEYVWLFDNDINLIGYNISRLLRNIHCSYKHKPLIVQPLIYENTQLYKFLNHNSWKDKNSIIAHQSRYIEIQTPIIRGIFFEWFLKYIVGRLLWPIHVLGVDYGIDELFCKSASEFVNEMTIAQYKMKHNIDYISKSMTGKIINETIPCALIMDTDPIHHWNDLHIERSLDGYVRRALNQQLLNIIEDTFPSYHLSGSDSIVDPHNVSNHDLGWKVSYEISKKCKF